MSSDQLKNVITVLGSGTSTGIPVIGCSCSLCKSSDYRDKRFRASIFLETSNKITFLIDTTPDLRSQALINNIINIDNVIITHEHADHIHGIDDLRPLCYAGTPHHINVYTSLECLNTLTKKFSYIFSTQKTKIPGGGIPKLKLKEVEEFKITTINGNDFIFFLLPHGNTSTLGFIHHNFAYITDCKSIPEKVLNLLQSSNIDMLIIEGIREKPHSTHLHFDQTFKYIDIIRPKRAGLIHLGHQFTHSELLEKCRKRFNFPVFPLIDGQKITYFTS